MSEVIIERVEALDPGLRDDLVRCWMAVNETGGGVGFPPGTPYEKVAAMLADHEAYLARGKGWLYVLRDADGRGIGFAFWLAGMAGGDHVATLKRFQLHPDFRGRGLGVRLLDYLHSDAVLAELDGVDFLHLQYRVGAGLGAWYATYGYTEIARYDLFRKRDDGTYWGWAEMLRTIDGSPLPSAGLL